MSSAAQSIVIDETMSGLAYEYHGVRIFALSNCDKESLDIFSKCIHSMETAEELLACLALRTKHKGKCMTICGKEHRVVDLEDINDMYYEHYGKYIFKAVMETEEPLKPYALILGDDWYITVGNGDWDDIKIAYCMHCLLGYRSAGLDRGLQLRNRIVDFQLCNRRAVPIIMGVGYRLMDLRELVSKLGEEFPRFVHEGEFNLADQVELKDVNDMCDLLGLNPYKRPFCLAELFDSDDDDDDDDNMPKKRQCVEAVVEP